MRIKIASNETRGVLGRLLDDQSGNVIMIMAAALVPLIGIVGGGIDMSRAYTTKARLQAACDAGSLAGRRAMATLAYGTNEKARADKMFNFNFKSPEYDATNVSFVTSADAKGKVSGTATAKIPTALMKIFGKNEFNLSVSCNADFQVPNIDTVLVLDVTGSMADCPDDTNCNSNSSSKIAGLKTAVKSFYTTLENAATSNPTTQLRYGFVPYSQTTNGADLFVSSPAAHQLPLTQLVNNWTYNSRVAEFSTPVGTGTPIVTGTSITNVYFRRSGSSTDAIMSDYDCNDYSNNHWISIDDGPDQGVWNFNPEGEPLYRADSSKAWSTTIPATGDYQVLEFRRLTPDFSSTSVGNDARTFKRCQREEKITSYTRATAYGFTKWIYKPVSYDVSSYKSGATINYVYDIDESKDPTFPAPVTYDLVQMGNLPNKSGLLKSTSSWQGCLEERSTVSAASFAPIPSDAEDLDYLNSGTDDATKWRPMMRNLGWIRDDTAEQEELAGENKPTNVWQESGTCPAARMQNLLDLTSSQVDTFVSTLSAGGNTYHDIGMVWALRMISPNGMFASRNATASNGGQISRNIIFMTDGVLVANENTYSSYGYERVDHRIAGGNNVTPDAATRHARRFQALCDAARSQGISVWTIAFGKSNPSNLKACADPGRAYTATNTTQLTQQFEEIAKSIADLRLTQ
jgi:Flp pilus assembly protein TadG